MTRCDGYGTFTREVVGWNGLVYESILDGECDGCEACAPGQHIEVANREDGSYCGECGEPWPCQFIRADEAAVRAWLDQQRKVVG